MLLVATYRAGRPLKAVGVWFRLTVASGWLRSYAARCRSRESCANYRSRWKRCRARTRCHHFYNAGARPESLTGKQAQLSHPNRQMLTDGDVGSKHTICC